MAESKPTYEVRLYDANGAHVSTVEHDEDLTSAVLREGGVIEADGKTYVWNQRNGQWRESGGTYKISKSNVEKVEPAAPAAPAKT